MSKENLELLSSRSRRRPMLSRSRDNLVTRCYLRTMIWVTMNLTTSTHKVDSLSMPKACAITLSMKCRLITKTRPSISKTRHLPNEDLSKLSKMLWRTTKRVVWLPCILKAYFRETTFPYRAMHSIHLVTTAKINTNVLMPPAWQWPVGPRHVRCSVEPQISRGFWTRRSSIMSNWSLTVLRGLVRVAITGSTKTCYCII